MKHRMSRQAVAPENTGAATTTWWIEAAELEVSGVDKAAWDEAVASFRRTLAKPRSYSPPSTVAGHLETSRTAIVGSTVDVVDLAELRRRRQ